MISNKYFESLDGTTKTFLADFVIKSEQYCRVYNYKYDPNGVDGEVDSATGLFVRTNNAPASADQLNLDDWALVNNIISFYTAPPANSTLVIEVATTPEELGEAVAGSAVLQAQDARDLALQYAEQAEGYRDTVVEKEALMNPHYTAIDAVYANEANINAVNANETNINTVAGIDSDVTTVAGIDTDVTTVATNNANVTTVATNIADVNTVADDIANVNAVVANQTNIDAAVANENNINTVATDIANVNAVGTNIANVIAVDNNQTNIDAVAGNQTNIDAVAGNQTNINAVVTNATNINTVATDIANVNAVAGNETNINTAVSNLAAIIAAPTAAANAAAAYDSFDDRYLGPKSSAPTTDNDGDPLITGAMYFDTTENLMYVRGNTGWQEAAAIDTTIITYNSADGGFANSTYTAAQSIDGGNANG